MSMANWTLNQKLALVALILGVIAIFGNPYRGHVVKVPAQDLAAVVQNEADQVTVEELSSWIVEGRSDYRLLDLRDQESFARYHIPSAENVPIGELVEYPLLSNEKIVVYADGELPSAQAWMLLRTAGFGSAYLLRGGLDRWKDSVLFPSPPSDPGLEESREFEKRVEVARFFGGSPRTAETGSSVEAPSVPMPTVEMASGPVVPIKKKRKKEGC